MNFFLIYRKLKGILKDPEIHDPDYFTTLAIVGFDVTTSFFSQRIQCQDDFIVDLTTRREPKGFLDQRS